MTDETPKTGWRDGALRALGAITVLLVPLGVAMLAIRVHSGTPVRIMAWGAAVYLVAYPAYRAARRGVKHDHTVGNLAWLMALLIGFLAISPTRFPWD